MKQYVSFISKEFMHILRDRRSMLILLAVPVVLLLFCCSATPFRRK